MAVCQSSDMGGGGGAGGVHLEEVSFSLLQLDDAHVRACASQMGEDEDKAGRPTTPWVRQVISGVDLMRHPK